MQLGVVKWFNTEKGFGVLVTPDEGEVFLHINSFKKKPTAVPVGSLVAFLKKQDRQRADKFTASESQFIEEQWGFSQLMQSLGKPDTVQLETKGKGQAPHSLLRLGTSQLFAKKSLAEFEDWVENYFDDQLAGHQIVLYCQYLEEIACPVVDQENPQQLAARLFAYFGERLTSEMLFKVWQSGKFRYIGYDEIGDYEIPEEVLAEFKADLGDDELERIVQYSFGPPFCERLAK